MKLYDSMVNEINALSNSFIEKITAYCKEHKVNELFGDKTIDIRKYNEELYNCNFNTDFMGFDDWGNGKVMELIGITFKNDTILCHFNFEDYEDINLAWMNPIDIIGISYIIECIVEDAEYGGELYFLDWDKYYEEMN